MPAKPHADRALDDRDEKAVQADVTRLLRALGYHVTDTSQPHAAKVTPGLPDLLAMHPGHRDPAAPGGRRPGHVLFVECKGPRGRLRPSQAAWHAVADHCGQVVVVARSAADLLPALRALGAPIG